MANMTDQNRVNWLLQAIFTASTSVTWATGTGGPTTLVVTPPYYLRLMSSAGSNTVAGSEISGSGYTALGASMGASAFSNPSAGHATNANLISWAATGTWPTVQGIEIWDSGSGTKLRWLQGPITNITGVVNGDTVQFAIASITADASQW